MIARFTGIAFSFFLLSGVATATADSISPITVAAAKPTLIAADDTLYVSGRIANKHDVRLAFKTSGLLSRVNVDVGDKVKKGQLLAGLDKQEVAANVDRAEAVLVNAKQALERLTQLEQNKVVGIGDLQSAEAARNVAQAELEIAQFNASLATIHAPASGVVLKRLAEAGELVQPGQSVLLLGANEAGWVIELAVSDRELVRIVRNDHVVITLDAYPGLSFNGVVRRKAALANASTGTFTVEVELQAEGRELYAGMVGRAMLKLASREEKIVVESRSLISADGHQGELFVVDQNRQTVHRQAVTIGGISGNKIWLIDGVGVDDWVVTSGASYLRDGSAISLKQEQQ